MTLEVIAGRYRVIRELGRGGMGAVYAVEHLHTGELLALKLLHASVAQNPDAVIRFKREARASAKIRSEHVVRVTDADVASERSGAPFLVMELLEGVDLEAFAKKQGRLRPEMVVAVLGSLARALDKAHQLGIVHRDLKPENLFLHRREDGGAIVKILDFGISKFAPEELDGSKFLVTSDGALMGTPYYMAPEQARGHANQVGPSTDVWALGLIAMRLLMAEVYWTARTLPELMLQVVSSHLTPPSLRWGVNDSLDAWFERSCNPDPARRFGTINEQVQALANGLRVPLSTLDISDCLAAELARVIGDAPPSRSRARSSGEITALESDVVEPPDGVPSSTTAAHLTRTDTQIQRPAPSRQPLLGGALGVALLAGIGYFTLSRIKSEPSPNLPTPTPTPNQSSLREAKPSGMPLASTSASAQADAGVPSIQPPASAPAPATSLPSPALHPSAPHPHFQKYSPPPPKPDPLAP